MREVIFLVMSYVWAAAAFISCIFAVANGRGAEVTGAILDGASQGIQLSITMAGPLCLWSGIGRLMEKGDLTKGLSKLLSPVLGRLFPQSRTDSKLAGFLSANVCANLLGLGNAATPMGIQAAGRLRDPNRPDVATDGLCRLVVMNTASIQLLPTTVAAIRRSAGCASPFDMLPCVWVSSILSVAAGLTAAALFRRIWKNA